MPSKKKPKLSFDLPADAGSGRVAGWVYRSDTAAGSGEKAPETGSRAAPSLSLAVRAMVQMVTLTMAVGTIPLTIGMQVLGALADTGGPRRRY